MSNTWGKHKQINSLAQTIDDHIKPDRRELTDQEISDMLDEVFAVLRRNRKKREVAAELRGTKFKDWRLIP